MPLDVFRLEDLRVEKNDLPGRLGEVFSGQGANTSRPQ
jgi:hypothetical protein